MTKVVSQKLFISLVLAAIIFTGIHYSSQKKSAAYSLESETHAIEKCIENLEEIDFQTQVYPTELADCQNCNILIRNSKGESIFWNFTSSELSEEIQLVKPIITGQHHLYISAKDSLSTNQKSGVVRAWFLVLLFLFLFLAGLRLSISYQHGSLLGILVTTVWTIIFCSLIPYLQFPNLVSIPIQTIHGLQLNLLQITVLYFGFAFMVNSYLQQLKLSNRHFKNFGPVLGSCVIAILLLSLVFFIQGAIYSDILQSSLVVPLQYSKVGITFLTFLLMLSGAIFHSTIQIHKAFSDQRESKPQYSAFVVGTALAIGMTYIFNFKTPTFAFFIFCISYLLVLDLFIEQKKRSPVFAFLWMIILSGFIASVIFYYRLGKDIDERAKFAIGLYTPENESRTSQIQSIDQAIRESGISTQLSSLPYPAKLDKADITSVVEEEIPADIKIFKINVECFKSDGSTLYNNHFSQIGIIDEKMKKSIQKSEYIYYDPLSGSYYLDYYIENDNYVNSPFRLNIRLRDKIAMEVSSNEFDYFIMRDSVLLEYNKIPPDIPLSKLLKIKESKTIQDISYVKHSPNDVVTVFTHNKLNGLLKPISLFSFILTLCGLMVFILGLVNSRFPILPKELAIKFSYDSSLKNKIQFTIIALTIFSFILIGLMTIIYFKNVLDMRNQNEKESKITSILNDIQTVVDKSNDEIGMASVLENQIYRIGYIHQKELHLFDLAGNLSATTKDSSTELMLPFSVHQSNKFHDPSSDHIHSEFLKGGLIHYIPLYSKQQQLYSTLGIEEDRDVVQSNNLLDFLSTILNVYIFLFLVAGAIAIAISNSITKPLSTLSEKLRQFKLGKRQEAIKWRTNDEIGSLISSYNDLTSKLEESANIIAKTERDTAWREMAKQVAHEIKNPLTPMKLSIQHLQRMSNADIEDMKPKIERISKTLLEQFNNLDNIANSFSNFARMPTASNEKVVINEVVESVHDLFRKREDIEITLSEPINDLYVYADRNHLVRVLNNIVKNAIQAIPNDRQGKIEMELNQVGNSAVILVRDNGLGIPEEMKAKVFTPNFTTKNSGTGLGLAISANMIEACNGKIYFETEYGEGTDFYIKIPLMRLDQNYDNSRRVVLE